MAREHTLSTCGTLRRRLSALTFALTLGLLLCVAGPGGVEAAGLRDRLAAHEGDWYASVLAGPTHLEDKGSLVGYKFGPAVSLAVGRRMSKYLRLDVEGFYQRNEIDRGDSSPLFFGGRERTVGALANLYFDLPFFYGFRPYIGGGVGWANVQSRADWGLLPIPGLRRDTVTKDTAAYQLVAGASYALTPQIELDFRGRYFGAVTSDIRLGLSEISEAEHFSGLVGLRFNWAPRSTSLSSRWRKHRLKSP